MTEKTVPAKRDHEVPSTREEERYMRPPVDIYEKENELVVICDMPGVAQDAIDIGVDDNVLTIEGKDTYEPPKEGLYKEFSLTNYFRQFKLNAEINQEKISAELKNGVLTIHLPKIEKPKPKKISIKVE